MPIEHTVVFRLVHSEGSTESDDFLAYARANLAPLPGVTAFTSRRQVSPKSDLTHQLSMVFADQAAYDGYNQHPTHVAFVEERWLPEVAEFQEYDFLID
ncbi:Dabb family protein (plasmid) [Coraliomargarita sp. W4R53]